MSKSFPLYYQTQGNPNHPCIILIMGIGGQLTAWPLSFIQGLVDKGFYVVTFDNRDSGLSHSYDQLKTPSIQEVIQAKQQGKPISLAYTLDDMASDVIALMDECQIKKAHILGISMGGIIAQLVAIHYPERVLRLICMASSSGDPSLPPAKKEVLEFFSSSLNGGSTSDEESINKKLQLFKLYEHPDFFNEEKARNQLTLAFKRSNNAAGFGRLLLAMMCAEPRTEKLKKLTIPALIIHGDYDAVFPIEHGKQLAEIIPQAHLAIIEKMGHGISEALCEKVVELIAA